MQLKVLYVWTKDDYRLMGMHYEPEKKNVGVVFIHGMAGNFIDNVFAQVMGETLARAGYGFLYGHNRGWGHVNDLAKRATKQDNGHEYTRQGAVYEHFPNCHFDIEAWIQKAKELGYKKIVLVGHSLGCNKLIYTWYRQRPTGVMGIVLSSPADMVGLMMKPGNQSKYTELLQEAKENCARGEYSKLLPGLIWDWYLISSQTFLDLFTEQGPADVLPIQRDPPVWKSLAIIDVPMMCVMGEFNDSVIKSVKEDLELIKSKATGCPDFQTAIIKGANHAYENREQELADTLLKWVKELL